MGEENLVNTRNNFLDISKTITTIVYLKEQTLMTLFASHFTYNIALHNLTEYNYKKLKYLPLDHQELP